MLGVTVTDQNLVHEEIKSRLNSVNACCHSIQNLLSSRLLSKSVRINIPVDRRGCETSSLTLREEHRLRVLDNRMLRRMFGLKMDEIIRDCRKMHSEELHNLYSSPNIIRMIK
jgi:hypothetical protein